MNNDDESQVSILVLQDTYRAWGTKKIVAQLGENTFQVFTETQSMAIKKVSEGWGSKPHILTLCANDMNSHMWCNAIVQPTTKNELLIKMS